MVLIAFPTVLNGFAMFLEENLKITQKTSQFLFFKEDVEHNATKRVVAKNDIYTSRPC